MEVAQHQNARALRAFGGDVRRKNGPEKAEGLGDSLRCVAAGQCRQVPVGEQSELVDQPLFVISGKAGRRRPVEIGRAHAELQSLMRISYAVFCLKKKKKRTKHIN